MQAGASAAAIGFAAETTEWPTVKYLHGCLREA